MSIVIKEKNHSKSLEEFVEQSNIIREIYNKEKKSDKREAKLKQLATKFNLEMLIN